MPEKIGHSIDGIEEYNNPVPRWLMMLLYATIVIAVVYLVLYPGFWQGATGWNQARMYENEIAASAKEFAAAKPAGVDLNSLMNDQTAILRGKEIFSQNCSPCHGPDAHGAIGPNLTDKEWLYGGKPDQIVHTVTEGTEKGMPPWKSQLGPAKIGDVAAFVHSLGGGQ